MARAHLSTTRLTSRPADLPTYVGVRGGSYLMTRAHNVNQRVRRRVMSGNLDATRSHTVLRLPFHAHWHLSNYGTVRTRCTDDGVHM